MTTRQSGAARIAAPPTYQACSQCHKILDEAGQHTPQSIENLDGSCTISFVRVTCAPFIEEIEPEVQVIHPGSTYIENDLRMVMSDILCGYKDAEDRIYNELARVLSPAEKAGRRF